MTNTINKHYTCVCLLFTSALTAASAAQAQTCTTAPSCTELGYTKTVSQCSGKHTLKCPFDSAAVSCEDNVIITCDSLGFTDTIAECPGESVKCPTDATKGKCILEARAGDLKYSLKGQNHNGWLLCNGSYYDKTKYADLYAAISTKFGSSGNSFRVPSYSGYFMKSAATTFSGSSLPSNFTSYQSAGLPNITGTIHVGRSENSYAGAFRKPQQTGGYSSHHDARDGGYYTFDASRCSSIYGNSTTVTPQNYSVNVFIYAGKIKP